MTNCSDAAQGVKVLVAGGAGFIGSHLCDALLERNKLDCLVCVDNFWTGSFDNIAHISDDRFHLERCDVEDFSSTMTFDEIYHLASPASPNWYMSEPRRTISANIIGAMNLFDRLAENGRFCFTSTSEVYGDPKVSPQPEDYLGSVNCTGPRSSYDEGKRVTEAFLFEMHRTRGTDIRVVRLFNAYGPRTRVDDGRAVSNFISQALRGQPLTIYGNGEQTRSWGYVDDIVEALARYFWRDLVDYPGPLNVGNNREVSVGEVAHLIGALTNASGVEYWPAPPDDPTNRCPDLTLINQVLPGWKCHVPYEEGVRRTLDWFREKTSLPT